MYNFTELYMCCMRCVTIGSSGFSSVRIFAITRNYSWFILADCLSARIDCGKPRNIFDLCFLFQIWQQWWSNQCCLPSEGLFEDTHWSLGSPPATELPWFIVWENKDICIFISKQWGEFGLVRLTWRLSRPCNGGLARRGRHETVWPPELWIHVMRSKLKWRSMEVCLRQQNTSNPNDDKQPSSLKEGSRLHQQCGTISRQSTDGYTFLFVCGMWLASCHELVGIGTDIGTCLQGAQRRDHTLYDFSFHLGLLRSVRCCLLNGWIEWIWQTVVIYSERSRSFPGGTVLIQRKIENSWFFILGLGMAPDSPDGVVCFVEEQLVYSMLVR